MVTYESLVEEKGYLFGYFFPLIVNAPPSRSLELLISSVIEDRKVILCRSPRHLRIRRVFILIFLLFLFFFSFFVWIAASFRPGLSHFPLSSLLFFSLVRNRGWAEPHQERSSLGEVILFTRSWARLLIEDSTLVIFARFEREEEGCARTVDCALWFRSGEDDCVWRSVDDDRIDFVQRLDGKVAYSKWSILFLIHFFNLSKILSKFLSFYRKERNHKCR